MSPGTVVAIDSKTMKRRAVMLKGGMRERDGETSISIITNTNKADLIMRRRGKCERRFSR